MSSSRVDSLFAGKGGATQGYPQRLNRYRVLAQVAACCAVLGPVLWLTPVAIGLMLWSWFGVRRILAHAKQLPEPHFLSELSRAHRTMVLTMPTVFAGCLVHVWLLQQPWYQGGLVGVLFR